VPAVPFRVLAKELAKWLLKVVIAENILALVYLVMSWVTVKVP